jgi:hypothetical protein
MKVVSDMLLIIGEPTKYLEIIYDIYSKNNLKPWTSCTNQVWNLVNPPEGLKVKTQ